MEVKLSALVIIRQVCLSIITTEGCDAIICVPEWDGPGFVVTSLWRRAGYQTSLNVSVFTCRIVGMILFISEECEELMPFSKFQSFIWKLLRFSKFKESVKGRSRFGTQAVWLQSPCASPPVLNSFLKLTTFSNINFTQGNDFFLNHKVWCSNCIHVL